jgi:hypothetical protein
MAKAKTPTDEKFEKIDFDLFEALAALDKKDYGYYDRLTEEQKQKFNPFMLIKWLTYIKGKTEVQQFYVLAGNEFGNKYMFNELVGKHPKLQWLMLCSATPGLGKQFRQWIPQISERVSRYKDKAKVEDIREYYSKIYPNSDKELLNEIAKIYVTEHKKKVYLAEKFPEMNFEEIETLSNIITDDDIQKYEKEYGN